MGWGAKKIKADCVLTQNSSVKWFGTRKECVSNVIFYLLGSPLAIPGVQTRLKQEAMKTIKALPKMTPGKQRGQAVGVLYSLPIRFQIEN